MQVSRCHRAELKVVQGDSNSAYYVCTECGRATDAILSLQLSFDEESQDATV